MYASLKALLVAERTRRRSQEEGGRVEAGGGGDDDDDDGDDDDDDVSSTTAYSCETVLRAWAASVSRRFSSLPILSTTRRSLEGVKEGAEGIGVFEGQGEVFKGQIISSGVSLRANREGHRERVPGK